MTPAPPSTVRELINLSGKTLAPAAFVKTKDRPPRVYSHFKEQFIRTEGTLRSAGLSREARITARISDRPELASSLLHVIGSAGCVLLSGEISEPGLTGWGSAGEIGSPSEMLRRDRDKYLG